MAMNTISGDDLDSQHSLNSERTFTLSSPSQKLWLSSQETEPDTRADNKINRETVFCDDIKTEITFDGDNVILDREVFQQILGKVSTMCDLQREVSLVRELCFEKFGKRGTPVSDPVAFKAFCKQAGAHKIFDAIIDSMSTDRQSDKRKGLNELRAVSVIYTLIFGQSQQANWFQVATARTLKGLGISDRGMETLRNMGLAAHPVTVNNACKKASADHLSSVQQTIHDATGCDSDSPVWRVFLGCGHSYHVVCIIPNISSCQLCEKSLHQSIEQLAAKANQAVFEIDVDEEDQGAGAEEEDHEVGEADAGNRGGEVEELSVEIDSFQDDCPSMEQLLAEIWGWKRPVITLS